MADDIALSLRFGFRRRCAWCGVVLRGWQLNRCRRCKQEANTSVVVQSPWCASASRWGCAPDAWRKEAQ